MTHTTHHHTRRRQNDMKATETQQFIKGHMCRMIVSTETREGSMKAPHKTKINIILVTGCAPREGPFRDARQNPQKSLFSPEERM